MSLMRCSSQLKVGVVSDTRINSSMLRNVSQVLDKNGVVDKLFFY